MQGKFITFEGPEGGGKSTHIRLLASWLQMRGVEVVCTREPGGTPLGEAVRGMLQFDSAGEAPLPRTEVMLFLASRAQHVAGLIQPALDRGAWVLCDRFSDSTLAYQGHGRGFKLAELRAVDRFATGGLRPDLTILLDVPLAVGRARLTARLAAQPGMKDRIECESTLFHERLRAGFLELARQEPERFVVLETAGREPPCVAAEISAAVAARCGLETSK